MANNMQMVGTTMSDKDAAQSAFEAQRHEDMLALARRMLRPASCENPLEPAETGSDRETLEQAAALALEAYAKGSSCVDLGELAATDSEPLKQVLAAHPEVCFCGRLGVQDDASVDGADVPLNLDGDLLYLTRCARMEARIAQTVNDRIAQRAVACADEPVVDKAAAEADDEVNGRALSDIAANLGLMTIGDSVLSAQQARAIAVAATHRFMVLTGGPGTGKTTVVVRIMAALDALRSRAHRPSLTFRLAAPTGKAADRLKEAIEQGAGKLAGVSQDECARLISIASQASTLHKLLRADPSPLDRFKHDQNNKLVGDVFIVDEVSMVSLSLLDAFLRAVPRDALVILVGDPDQLASVDAGTVLSDLVQGLRAKAQTLAADDVAASEYGQADDALRKAWQTACAQRQVQPQVQENAAAWNPALTAECAVGLVRLNEGHRSSGDVSQLVEDIQKLSECRDDEDAQVDAALKLGEDIRAARTPRTDEDGEDGEGGKDGAAAGVIYRQQLKDTQAYRGLIDHFARIEELASQGKAGAREALNELGEMILLCANRVGKLGALDWNAKITARLAADRGSGDPDAFGERVGCPIIVTRNDRDLGLSNGDVGVLVRMAQDGDSGAGSHTMRVGQAGVPTVCFADPQAPDGIRCVPRALINEAQTAYALTIHKSQGSEYRQVIVQLAGEDESPLNVRELLYTGVSRAKVKVWIVGSPAALDHALVARVRRASGLARRLR